jgi:hypothetical protein
MAMTLRYATYRQGTDVSPLSGWSAAKRRPWRRKPQELSSTVIGTVVNPPAEDYGRSCSVTPDCV